MTSLNLFFLVRVLPSKCFWRREVMTFYFLSSDSNVIPSQKVFLRECLDILKVFFQGRVRHTKLFFSRKGQTYQIVFLDGVSEQSFYFFLVECLVTKSYLGNPRNVFERTIEFRAFKFLLSAHKQDLSVANICVCFALLSLLSTPRKMKLKLGK